MDLLFDDLVDWNNWFVKARSLAPLGIICLGSEEGQMRKNTRNLPLLVVLWLYPDRFCDLQRTRVSSRAWTTRRCFFSGE